MILISLMIFVSACNQNEEVVDKSKLISTITVDTVIQEKEAIQDNFENFKKIPTFPKYDYEQNIYPSEILVNGLLHGNEVVKNAESKIWYGLFISKDNKLKIKKTELILETVFDPIVDKKGDEPSGIVVNVNEVDTLIILLAKIDLQENKDVFVINNHPTEILPDEDFEFRFGDISYKLIAKGIKQRYENSEKYYAAGKYQLYLHAEIEGEKIETLVSSYPQFDDSMIKILFIGDIDSDGKIDLIIDNSPKYNSFTPTLYLSSMAENADLLKIVAMRKFLGC